MSDDDSADLPPPEAVDSLLALPEDADGEYVVDFREHPEYYRVDRGERGVFKVQPYKSELLPLWEYADRAAADRAASAIYDRFRDYRAADDFPGMDMARKYLQLGYTRAMRYARYPGGQKYVDGEERDPVYWADEAKRQAALVFDVWLTCVRGDETYRSRREEWPPV